MMYSKMAESILDVDICGSFVVYCQFKLTVVVEMSNGLYPEYKMALTSNQNRRSLVKNATALQHVMFSIAYLTFVFPT